MLPIIIKDLVHNAKTWLLFASASLASSMMSGGEETTRMTYGFTHALTLGSSLIFSHTVVLAERRRRHLVFLKSLPVTDCGILGAKFIAVLVLALSLAVLPGFPGLLFSDSDAPGVTILELSLVALYACSVLSLYICFQNPALPFLPLYCASLIIVWSQTSEVIRLPGGFAVRLLLSLLASALVYCVTLAIFRNKELDL